MASDNRQRDPRKECIEIESIEDSTIPIDFLNENKSGQIHALLINGSVSGCCLMCKSQVILPSAANIDFFEENEELWRVKASLDIKWEKRDLSISYCLYGMVLDPASEGDKFVWEELYESLLRGERQYICCILHPI